MTEIVQIFTAAIGSLAFGVLFNIRGKKLLSVFLGGGAAWLFVLLLMHFGVKEPLAYLVVAFLISVYAEVLARKLKAPTTVFVIPCLIPLVPGSSLYYTMAYALNGQKALFLSRALSTLSLAAALAIGIVIATVLTRLCLSAWQTLKARKDKHREG